jgi:hypothetical protein
VETLKLVVATLDGDAYVSVPVSVCVHGAGAHGGFVVVVVVVVAAAAEPVLERAGAELAVIAFGVAESFVVCFAVRVHFEHVPLRWPA